MNGRKRVASITAISAAVIALFVYWLVIPDHAGQPRPPAVGNAMQVPDASPQVVDPPNSQHEATGATVPERRSIDREALIAALASPDESVRSHAVEHLFAYFAKEDPAAARRIVESTGASSQRARLVQILAIALARADRRDALEWAAAIPDAVEREDATSVVLTEISMTEPSEAVRLRQDAGRAADDPVLENLVQRWAEKDLTEALQWADSLPPGEQRDRVHARAAFIQSQTSPESAANLIVNRMSSNQAQEEALISVLHQWAKLDVDSAERWIEKLPAGALQVRATAELNAIARTQ